MITLLLSIVAISVYCALSAILILRLVYPHIQALRSKFVFTIAGAIAVTCHGRLLYQSIFTPMGIDVGFFSALSLVSWLMATLLILTAFKQAVENLAIVVLPFAAITLFLRLYYPQHNYLSQQIPLGLEIHILASIFAYSLLSIASAQAILLYIQDKQLHNKRPGGFIRTLPPLEAMESLLFKMIGMGFIVLSVSLISGIPYLEDILKQHLAHKTVLSVIAWVLFAVLLWGRLQFGWRGRVAIRWTLSGFLLLMLAYFGSKFVIELILNY